MPFQSHFLRIVLFALAFVAIGGQAATTQYFYDELKRLKTVINSDGSIIEYTYDANGSMTSINRISSNTLSISLVTPSASYVGSSISIHGTGFSAVTNQNAVTIGGAAATVTAATANTLTVTVPGAANTGLASATTNGQTVFSAQNFTVLRPTITNVMPLLVNQGAAISLTGTNLSLVPGSSTVAVGGLTASTSSLTNTQAIFPAPNGSGFVSVNTPYGQATSANPLVVLPSPIALADAVTVNAVTPGGSGQTVNVSQLNKYGVLHFSGTQGQALSLQVTSLTLSPSNQSIVVYIYSPSNAVIGSGTLTSSNKTIHLPILPATGRYLISFQAPYATYQMTAAIEVNSSVVADAAPVSNSTTSAGLSKRFVIPVNAGDKVGLGISNLVKTNGYEGYTYQSIKIDRPDGTSLVSNVDCVVSTGCEFNLDAATTGNFSVFVFSPSPANEPNLTFSYTATVSTPFTVAASPNSATPVNIARVGQNGRVTFAGTAGESMGLQVGGLSTTPAGRAVSMSVLKPDGTTLQSFATSSSTGNGKTFNLINLPATGTYTLSIDPQYGAMANLSVVVASGSPPTLTVNGATKSINTTSTPGAAAYFSFSATAGDVLPMGIGQITRTNGHPSYTGVDVSLYRPDGTALYSEIQCPTSSGCDFNPTAPTTGTYTVLVVSQSTYWEPNLSLSFTAAVSTPLLVSAPAAASTPVNLARFGQYARISFAGTAGTNKTIQITGITTVPSGTTVSFAVLKPDGTVLQTGSGTSTATLDLTNLPVTGTYVLIADAPPSTTANLTVTLP